MASPAGQRPAVILSRPEVGRRISGHGRSGTGHSPELPDAAWNRPRDSSTFKEGLGMTPGVCTALDNTGGMKL
ncbi:MAG: hypothetical protein AB9891_07070 [Anaerolineaceae bacterium]